MIDVLLIVLANLWCLFVFVWVIGKWGEFVIFASHGFDDAEQDLDKEREQTK